VSKEWGPFLDASVPSFKPAYQEFNILKGIGMSGECLGTGV